MDSGFSTLTETVYSTISEAIARTSAQQQVKVDQLIREIAELGSKVDSIHSFSPKKETRIWNVIQKPNQ